jgi:hypothetical protein
MRHRASQVQRWGRTCLIVLILPTVSLASTGSPASASGAIQIHQFNMAGWAYNHGSHTNGVVDEITGKVVDDFALGASLQEVCVSQYLYIRPTLEANGYATRFREQRGGAATGGVDLSPSQSACGGKFGIAVATYAWDSVPAEWDWYTVQDTRVDGNGDRMDSGQRAWYCLPGAYLRSIVMCSTHLTSRGDATAFRTQQSIAYYAKVHNHWPGRNRWAGGDMNAEPEDNMFDQWYSTYWEADVDYRYSSGSLRRTKCDNLLKIDYMWAIKDHTTTTGDAAKSCAGGHSDHEYYIGYFDWD